MLFQIFVKLSGCLNDGNNWARDLKREDRNAVTLPLLSIFQKWLGTTQPHTGTAEILHGLKK